MTRKWGKRSPECLPEFDDLREQQPHALLAALHRRCVLQLGKVSSCHYDGLSQAARNAKLQLGAGMVTKLVLVDEAHHLLRHLSPESCTIVFSEVCAALGGDHEALMLLVLMLRKSLAPSRPMLALAARWPWTQQPSQT